MPRTQKTSRTRRRTGFLGSTTSLALGRMRQNRLLLLVIGVGLLAALTLVSIVPLLSQITLTAGLRDTLRAAPANSTLLISAPIMGLSSQIERDIQHQLDAPFQRDISGYLEQAPDFTISASMKLISPSLAFKTALGITGVDVARVASHMTLLEGKLPQSRPVNGEVEILLTAETAQDWHVGVGSEITFGYDFAPIPQSNAITIGVLHLPTFTPEQLKVRVAGIFSTGGDTFWYGRDFNPHDIFLSGDNSYTQFSAVLPNQALLSAFDQFAASNHTDAIFTPDGFAVEWDYHLNVPNITINQLDDLRGRLDKLVADLSCAYGPVTSLQGGYGTNIPSYPYVLTVILGGATLHTSTSEGLLQQYSTRSAVTRIPVFVLSLQLAALMLFFVSLIIDLLVERQAEAIALMRSRGASGWQVFSALLLQCAALCLVALSLAPLLAFISLKLLLPHVLAAGEQDAVASVISGPGSVLATIGWYLLGTVLVALVAMALALSRAIGMDVLSIRRSSSRSSQRPLWQRLYLDVLAGIIALLGYGLSLYFSSVGGLVNTSANVLVGVPLSLIAPLFFVLGCLLLFLRLFPLWLRLGARIALRGRGATPMLALAQMARAPGRSVRMAMLLALTLAFGIFTLLFTSTQAQHLSDLANYEAGADFSGDLALASQSSGPLLSDALARYGSIPGVQASSAGFVSSGSAEKSGTLLHIIAVDSSSFGNVGIWPQQASSQSLDTLMVLLSKQRASAVKQDVVPVIVDELALKRMGLHIGSTFSVTVNGVAYSLMRCVVVGEVEHITGINDSTAVGNGTGYQAPGGLLVDYQTYNAIYQQDESLFTAQPPPLPINHIWLHTRDDASSLASIRAALQNSSLALVNLNDRRLMIESLSGDPLYLNLVSLLTLGAATALILALLGDLLASWSSIRLRLTNFALLRALGASPQQVVSVLSWEQGSVYVTALLLGLGFGALLSATIIPALAFNNVPTQGSLSKLSNGEFYALQYILPPKTVIPATLSIAIVVLLLICVLTLVMMVRAVSKPALSQTLRLNQD